MKNYLIIFTLIFLTVKVSAQDLDIFLLDFEIPNRGEFSLSAQKNIDERIIGKAHSYINECFNNPSIRKGIGKNVNIIDSYINNLRQIVSRNGNKKAKNTDLFLKGWISLYGQYISISIKLATVDGNPISCKDVTKNIPLLPFPKDEVILDAFCNISENISDCLSGNKMQNKLKVGFTYDAPMYYKVDGKETGFAYELAEIIASELELELSTEVITYKEASDFLTENINSIAMSGFIPNYDIGKDLVWSDTYVNSDLCLIVNTNKAIKSIEDVKNYIKNHPNKPFKIGTYDENFVKLWIEKNLPYPNVKQIPNTKEDWFLGLITDTKEFDIIINDYPYAIESLKKHKQLKIADFHLNEVGYSIVSHEKNEQLIIKINKVLEKIKGKGKYQDLYQKYFCFENFYLSTLEPECPKSKQVMVGKNQTIIDIAKENNTTPEALYKANKSRYPAMYCFKVGDILCIPE